MIKKLRTLGRAAARLRNYCARMVQPSFTQREKAFTLVELLIVIAIIAILTVAFLPNVLKAPAKARDAIRVKQVSDIANAVEVYATERGEPPNHETGAKLVNCVTSNIAGQLGINRPVDSKGLGSCTFIAGNTAENDGTTPNTQLFYYRYHNGEKFYVVAAKLENASASNTDATPIQGEDDVDASDGFHEVGTLALLKGIMDSKPGGTETDVWYVAYGPQ